MDFKLPTTTSPSTSELCSDTRGGGNRPVQRTSRARPAHVLSARVRTNMGCPGPLALALPLWMCFGRAAATLHEPQICYVLDGILFLYGIVLTTLYCRLKVISCKKDVAEKPKGGDEGIYSGLTQPADTYETIGMKT